MLPYNVSTIANSGLTPRQLFNIDTIKVCSAALYASVAFCCDLL